MNSIKQLLSDYKKNNSPKETEIINFIGVDGFDVYNITAPFYDNGKLIIAGRVEKRDSEHSKIMFFEKLNDIDWKLVESLPVFELQDPYFTFINNELILGGTEIFDHPTEKGALWYKAVKYRGKNILELKKFFDGPNGMKDIRLLELPNKKVLVFTRPQGEIGGRGQIGRVIIDSLEELNDDVINKADLFDLFIKEEWGGGNELYNLGNNKVGVLGHIASFDEDGNRHYYSMTFVYDYLTDTNTKCEIISIREDLKPGATKRPDLEDVIFSGGIENLDKEIVTLYNGVSDCESHFIKIPNPFIKYMEVK